MLVGYLYTSDHDLRECVPYIVEAVLVDVSFELVQNCLLIINRNSSVWKFTIHYSHEVSSLCCHIHLPLNFRDRVDSVYSILVSTYSQSLVVK